MTPRLAGPAVRLYGLPELGGKMMRRVFAFTLVAALSSLAAPAISAQETTQQPAPAEATPPETSGQAPTAPASANTDRVVVSGESMRSRVYDLFRQLDGPGICPTGFKSLRGHSCAEITYEVYSADGDFLRRCNMPVFKLIDSRDMPFEEEEDDDSVAQLRRSMQQRSAEGTVSLGQNIEGEGEAGFNEDPGGPGQELSGYFVTTFDRMTCGDKKKRDVETVSLQQLLNPRTSDNTRFQAVSILGYSQMKDICRISKEHCALELFDRRKELKSAALKEVWPIFD
jgi:hypothetical protein